MSAWCALGTSLFDPQLEWAPQSLGVPDLHQGGFWNGIDVQTCMVFSQALLKAKIIDLIKQHCSLCKYRVQRLPLGTL